MANDKKYLSKIVKGGNTLWLKDAEARQEIADIKSSITGAMHFIGVSSTAIADGDATGPWTINGMTYIASGTPAEGEVLLVSGDVAVYAPSGKAEREFVWSGTKWQEYGSTGSLKALAFKDSASATYTPAGTNAASAVSFSGQTDGDFVTGFDTAPAAPSFSEGPFTPAEIQTGFVTPGSAASYSHSGFDGGSLGAATTGNFATEGETSSYDESEETLTFSDASTSAAVTAQGTFTPATYGTDSFDGGTPTAIDVTKFSGGSKVADSFSAGTVPTLATGKAITAVGTGTAAAQTFSGTEATITAS